MAGDGTVAVRRQVRRAHVVAFFDRLSLCLVGVEACASAQYWARELAAVGYEVKLMPPASATAYVKRGKTGATDVEAIAEAVTRPTLRFVAVKSRAQQAVLMLHKTKDLLARRRTGLTNALRGHVDVFGILAPQGASGIRTALSTLKDTKSISPIGRKQRFSGSLR